LFIWMSEWQLRVILAEAQASLQRGRRNSTLRACNWLHGTQNMTYAQLR
jgi:hypothetical protein